MANPTTNYGFIMPSSTDLVTDLPADFDVFGQAVDTQMLTNANAAIAKAIVDAKGDLISATAADTPARLAVGADGTVLTADSAETTGIKWATSASGGMTLINTGGTTLSGASTTVTTIPSTYNQLYIVLDDFYAAGRNYVLMEFNSDTTATNYFNAGTRGTTVTSAAAFGWNSQDISVNNVYQGDYNNKITLTMDDYASTTNKVGNHAQLFNTQTGEIAFGQGMFGYTGTSAISSITVYISGSNWSGGKIYVYGVK